ncbi:MAG: LptF/LptG family permease [Planctomycetes bacterium]|nr:LptF/LptG family permease [Planctomycetota bacterium]
MTRIDRYLLILYVRVFLICFVTLSGLLIIAQVFTNLDEFIQYGRNRGNFFLALAEYYSPYLLSIYDRTCGLLTLLSTMFVIAWLYRTNELTALLAAGISKARIVRPVIVMSVIAILGAACSRELLIPKWSATLSKNPQDLQGTERLVPMRPTEDVDMGILIAGRNLITNTQSIQNPIFKFYSPASNVTSQLSGTVAMYLPADKTHGQGFRIDGVSINTALTGKPSVRQDGIDYLLLPADTPWLTEDQCFVPSKVEYDMLRGGTARQFASTSDLIWRLKNQSDYYGEDLKLMVHSRFLQPLLDFTQLLLGLPLILSTRNRNVVQLIVACVATFGLFFAVSMALGSLGTSGTLITPAIAAWAPLLIFGPIAYARTRQSMME